MAQAKRDENRVAMGMGVSSVDGITPTPFYCDPVTGRLLIEIDYVSEVGGAIPVSPVQRDQNHKTMTCAVTDDANTTLTPLIVDHRNNYLYVDVLVQP